MPRFFLRHAVALLAVWSAAGASESRGEVIDLRLQVDAVIRPIMAENDLPGVAVGVCFEGRSEFFYYGVASRDQGNPVGADTLFEIGSVSKTFNATLACYAEELGALSLTDAPSRFWPVLKGTAIDRATLLQLGTYTAGDMPLQVPDEVTDDARLTAYLKRWSPSFAPGTHRCYSNLSVGLLGRLTALSLKSSYAMAVEHDLLPRLGLKHTYIHIPDTESKYYAWGHGENSSQVRVSPGVFDDEAYGIKTTASDLLHFIELNMDPRSLDEPMQRAILRTHVPFYEAGPLRQGLGWEQYPYPVSLDALLLGNSAHLSMEPNEARAVVNPEIPGTPVLYNKTGSTNGFGAYAVFVPSRRVGIVLLANRYYPNAARVRAAYVLLQALGHETAVRAHKP